MSGIRVTYSGLVAFGVGIAGVLLGLIFTLMITRSLTPEEFGTYSLILSVVGYFLVAETIISYWAIRHTARGENIGKTAMLSSFGVAGAILPIFAVYVFFISQTSGISFEVLLLGAVLIPANYISMTLTGINTGHKPHAVSYSLFLFDLAKIVVGALTILVLQWDVFGTIMAILAAFICKIIFQTYIAMPKIKAMFQPGIAVKWIKASWLPTFIHLQSYIGLLDMVLYSVITGSVLGVAYYNAAFVIGRIATHAGTIAQAVYPKIIADRLYGGVTKNAELLLYFAIPMMVISIMFAEAGLFVLNPVYIGAWPAVILLAVKNFAHAIRIIPLSILTGTEQADTESMSFSRLAKSNLFKIPLILTVFNIGYIGGLVGFLFLSDPIIDEFETVVWWAAIGLAADIPVTVFVWRKAHHIVQLNVHWKRISKFALGAMSQVGVFHITSGQLINYDLDIYLFLVLAVVQLTLCVAAYLGVTYAIDKDVRSTFRTILSRLGR